MPKTASETTRKVADPLRAADLGSDPFISVADDDEEPTRLRDSQVAVARHRLPTPGGPRGSVVPAARSAPAPKPVPASSARPRPVPVVAYPTSASPPARLRIPPPPPRDAAPAPRPPPPDSPFEAADERDQFPATPPPLPKAGAAPARAPAPSFMTGTPPSDAPGFGPVNQQHSPDIITFRTEPPVPLPRRGGPPRLLVLLVMLAAVAGGAKLAAYVTRADLGTGTLLDSR